MRSRWIWSPAPSRSLFFPSSFGKGTLLGTPGRFWRMILRTVRITANSRTRKSKTGKLFGWVRFRSRRFWFVLFTFLFRSFLLQCLFVRIRGFRRLSGGASLIENLAGGFNVFNFDQTFMIFFPCFSQPYDLAPFLCRQASASGLNELVRRIPHLF